MGKTIALAGVNIVAGRTELDWGVREEHGEAKGFPVRDLNGVGSMACHVDEEALAIIGTAYELSEFIHLVGRDGCECGVFVGPLAPCLGRR